MYKGKKILAVIPARGGSKRLPHKNIRPLLGKPLIAWTIEQAKNSRYVDSLMVSTDDKEIRRVSIRYGAKVPFLRPARLAKDKVLTIAVVKHLLTWLEQRGQFYDFVLVLQPTSPLRRSEDIDGAIRYMISKKADAVISVCKSDRNPLFLNTLPRNRYFGKFFKPSILGRCKRKLPTFYMVNGAIYLAHWDYLKRGKTFFAKNSFAYVMPAERSVDIDTELDLMVAEALMKINKRNK